VTLRVDKPPEGRLFQERLHYNPFWMLIACQLVNLTTWRQAEPAFRWILATYLTPGGLAAAEPSELQAALRPLGLWRRRSITIPRFARTWILKTPDTAEDVLRMPGCGKYASDSWAIFVEDRTDVEPRDGKLNWYLASSKTLCGR
jgi:endonuclease III